MGPRYFQLSVLIAAREIDQQYEWSAHEPAGLRPPQAPTLGWIYITEAYAFEATLLLNELRQRWPGCSWVGAVGTGICAGATEYFDAPALAVMICDLPQSSFRVFSGVSASPLLAVAAVLEVPRAAGAAVTDSAAGTQLDKVVVRAPLQRRTRRPLP